MAGCLAVLLLSAPGGAADRTAGPQVIVFGGSAYYPPFEWLDEQDQPLGFNVDLERAIAASGGRRAEHRLMDWSDATAALARGSVDVMPMFHSETRAEKYLFTTPFYYVMHAVYGRPDAGGVTGPESLDGERVAVVASGYALSTMTEMGIGSVPVPRPNIEQALLAVINGEARFALVARATAGRIVETRGLDLQALGPPFWPRPYAFAVRRDRPELAAWLERNLRQVIAEGTYHDLYAAWEDDLEWSRPGVWDLVRRVSFVGIPLFVLAVLGYCWSWQLRRRVTARTRELRSELARREAAEEELRYQARHESLTGLPTRSEFVRLADRTLSGGPGKVESAMVATVSLVELDRIITAFGYEAGEGLLAEFGRRLGGLGFAAAGDFGRGVFCVLLVDSIRPSEILGKLTAPVVLGDLELDPHIQIGFVRYPGQGRSVAELVRKAETALAEASERHRGLIEYDAGMEPDQNDLLIVRDFRRPGTGDLYAVFQPIIDLRGMRMVGAEALARWDHPEFGLIGPDRFVPLLERAGVIQRLTERMAREAIRVGRDFQMRGVDLPISVNVSAVDLLEVDLESLIGGLLAEFQANPEAIRLEMTETSVIEDPYRVSGVVSGLRRMGIRCGIDDFGVGYSSLSYLSEFSVDEAKIDRSFVSDMRSSERHGTIVRSTIALAHELGLAVVAEGVEDWETVAMLQDQGCDRAQGFVFSEPVAEDRLASLVGKVFSTGA